MQAATQLPKEAQDWIAYALLVGHEDTTILGHLSTAGFSPDQVLPFVAEQRRSPLFDVGRRFGRELAFCNWFFQSQSRLQRLDGLDRLGPGDGEKFVHDYLRVNRPVRIDGLIQDWPALHKWTAEGLRREYGHMTIEHMRYQVVQGVQEPTRIERPLHEFLDIITDPRATEKTYWTAYNQQDQSSPFVQALRADMSLPAGFCDPNGKEPVFFWIGPEGTRTGMHFDPHNVLFVQVVGRKRWVLVPPWELLNAYLKNDFFSQVDVENPQRQAFPRYRPEAEITVELGPGDALLVPFTWLHQVTSLSFSVSVSLTNLALPGRNEFESPSAFTGVI